MVSLLVNPSYQPLTNDCQTDRDNSTRSIESISIDMTHFSDQPAVFKFCKLPDDCQIRVFSFFRLQELLSLSRVSRHFYQITNELANWQEVYERSPFPSLGSSSIDSKQEMIAAVKKIHEKLDNKIIKVGQNRILKYLQFCHHKTRLIMGSAGIVFHSCLLIIESDNKQIKNNNLVILSAIFGTTMHLSHVLLSCGQYQFANQNRKTLSFYQFFVGTSSILLSGYIRNLVPITSISQAIFGSFFIIGGIPRELYLRAYHRTEKRKLNKHSIEQKILNPRRVSFCHVISSVIKGLFCWKTR